MPLFYDYTGVLNGDEVFRWKEKEDFLNPSNDEGIQITGGEKSKYSVHEFNISIWQFPLSFQENILALYFSLYLDTFLGSFNFFPTCMFLTRSTSRF